MGKCCNVVNYRAIALRSDTKIIYGVNPEFGVADGAGRSPCIPNKAKRQKDSLRYNMNI